MPTSGNDTIDGTPGNDTIDALAGDDLVRGGAGDDSLLGGVGADTLLGGEGNDTFTYSEPNQAGVDLIDGGDGTDALVLGAFAASYVLRTAMLTTSAASAAIERLVLVGGAVGAEFNANQFATSSSPNGKIAHNLVIEASVYNGSITIHDANQFSAAAWTLAVQAGNLFFVEIHGTSGADTLTGWIGRDTINGGDGADRINGSPGVDYLRGLDGDDVFVYAAQTEINSDTIDGGLGVDELSLSLGSGNYDFSPAFFQSTSESHSIERLTFSNSTIQTVTLNANQFWDYGIDMNLIVRGAIGLNLLIINNAQTFSAEGFRLLNWDSAIDRIEINGTGAANSLTGTVSRDVLNGGDGADTLTGGPGADTLDGGAGSADWTSYFSAPSAVVIFRGAPALGHGDAAGDVFTNIEFFELTNVFGDTYVGGGGSDLVFGQGGGDTLFGGSAYDALYGGDGDDVLLGGDAGDFLDGGSGGFDLVSYGDSVAAVSINLTTNVNGGFAAGDTMAGIEGYLLTEQGDTIVGRDDPNTGDIFYSLGGADSLVGLGGFDYLIGGDGADTLVGGFGWDLLIGGAGADRFVWNTGGEGGPVLGGGSGGDVVQDFQAGLDKLAFVSATTGITGLTLGANLFIQNGGITGVQGSGGGPTLIYDTGGGGLWYDTNGNAVGGLIYLATIVGAPALTAADFMVI